MSAFDIPPHSRRITGLALGALALVAMAAFAEAFIRQMASDTPAPPPRPNAAYANIAEATPAAVPVLQTEAPKPHKAAAPNADDADDDDPAASTAPVAAQTAVAAPAGAADAAATAPDAAAAPATADQPAAAPSPAEAPTA